MRCYICDRVIEEPIFNRELDDKIEPCDACMVVIHDTLAGYTDKPSAAEGELPDDPVIRYPGFTKEEWAAIAAANSGIPYD